MRKRLTNKLTMYKQVEAHLNQNNSLWSSFAAMAAAFSDLESLLAEIETYRQLTGQNRKGNTQQKALQQEQLISRTFELSSQMCVMAIRKKDAILAAKVNFTETSLIKKRDDQLVIECSRVADLADEHLPELADYRVTEDELNALREIIKQFSDNLPSGRVMVSERKAANKKLRELFAQVDALLKQQLDRIMVRYRESHPEFYMIYRNLRRIENYGVRHVKTNEPEKEPSLPLG